MATVAAAPRRREKPPKVSARAHNAVLQAAQKRVDDLEPRLAAVIEPLLHRAGTRAATLFHERATRHLVPDPSLVAAGPAWSPPFPDELIDVDALVAQILAKTDPVRKALIEQTMTPALEQAGLSFDVSNPLTAKLFADTGSQVTNIAMTTRANLMSIIGKAYQSGLSIPQTSNLIREGMRAASKTRSTMIARTEMARAVNGGSLAATQLVSQATGQAYNKVWRTAPGARYPRHEDYPGLDGQTVGQDETFTVGGDQLQYPGDPDGDPGETINCRCTLTYAEVPTVAGVPAAAPSNAEVTSEAAGVSAPGLPQVNLNIGEPEVVTADVAEAAKALAAGKRVQLTQISEVNTFIDRLGQMAADAQKAGKAAPNLDLGKVSIPGTNLFTQESLGVPRVDMPQLAGLPVPGSPAEKLPTTMFEGKPSPWRDITQPFLQSLRDQGVAVTDEEVSPETLRATQNELNGPKIAGLMDKLESGVDISGGDRIPISSDNYILDGHHRWAAYVGRDYQTGVDVPHPIAVERIDEPITTILQQARDYSEKMGIPPQSAFESTTKAVTPPVPAAVPETAMAKAPPQSVEIGISPFRAGTDNAVGFYDTARYQQFVNDVNQSAEAYGVHVDAVTKDTGVWADKTEPAVSVRVSDAPPEPDTPAYRSQNSAPQAGPRAAPLSDLTENGIYPDDVYKYDSATQADKFGISHPEVEREAFNIANGVKGDPTALVTVYRAVPAGVEDINPGDWVTTVKEYADSHATGVLGKQEDAHVISMQVPAGQLYTSASILQYGWDPPAKAAFDAAARFRAFAANLGRSYNQDGVMLFTPDPQGDALMATFQTANAPEQTIAAMKEAGIEGGRFTSDGRLQVIGSGPDFAKRLARLSRALGRYDVARGTSALLERDKGDYRAALDAFSHPQGPSATVEPEREPAPPAKLTRAPAITGYPTSGFGPGLEKIKRMNEKFVPLGSPQAKWVEALDADEDLTLGVDTSKTNQSMTETIDRYTGAGSHDVNNYLAGNKVDDSNLREYRNAPEVADNAKEMLQIIDSAPPLPPGTTLYRGINAYGVNPDLLAQARPLTQEILAKPEKQFGLDKLERHSPEWEKIWNSPEFQAANKKATRDAWNVATKAMGDWAKQEYPVGSYVAMAEPGEITSLTLNPALAANFGLNSVQPSVVFRVLNAKTGAPIFPFSRYTDESEILAPPDTMYRVRSVQLAKMDGGLPELGGRADRVVVTLEEAPKCGPVTAALTAATGVACTNVAQYVPKGDAPVTVGSGDLFPGQPRSVADAAAAHRDAQIAEYAQANNMSVADYKSAAQEAIRSYVALHPQIRIRLTHQALEQVLEDGRFKNEFQLPGVTDQMVEPRVEAEQNLFGIKPNAAPADRPIYGYLAGTADETGEVQEYGDIIVNLDPSVNARATFTIGDSYSAGINSELSPSLLSDPGIGSWDGNFDIVKAWREGNIGEISRYVEVEIHGGLPLSDVGGITPDQALIVAHEDAARVKDDEEAITEIYANNKGTQTESPQVEQSGLPTDKPPQFDYASALREIGKNAGLRQGALADLIARVGLKGIVAGDFEDFNVLQAIGAGNL